MLSRHILRFSSQLSQNVKLPSAESKAKFCKVAKESVAVGFILGVCSANDNLFPLSAMGVFLAAPLAACVTFPRASAGAMALAVTANEAIKRKSNKI